MSIARGTLGTACPPASLRKYRAPVRCAAVHNARGAQAGAQTEDASRRVALGWLAAGITTSVCQSASAFSGNPLAYKKELAKRRAKIPIEAYTDGPEGLKYYDVEVGGGTEAKVGARVAVHLDVKWRGVTFFTSRQGVGVTGGTPLGFDVGQAPGEAGSTMAGVDLGVRGMRIGGIRRLLVPPGLAYGSKGLGEIGPDATLTVDLELLSIKTSPLGFRTKLIEG